LGVSRISSPVEDAPSSDPFTASLRYARCLRENGVPQPDPDRRGDFHLSLSDERRIQAIPLAVRKSAEGICFHHLKGLNLQPLTAHAIALAEKVMAEMSICVRGYGHMVGGPLVRNLSRGRVSFGFKPTKLTFNVRYWQSAAGRLELRRLVRDEAICSKKLRTASRLSKIIAEDRRATDNI
jgi:hypothetical protein